MPPCRSKAANPIPCGLLEAVHDGESQAAFVKRFAEDEVNLFFVEGAKGFVEMRGDGTHVFSRTETHDEVFFRLARERRRCLVRHDEADRLARRFGERRAKSIFKKPPSPPREAFRPGKWL